MQSFKRIKFLIFYAFEFVNHQQTQKRQLKFSLQDKSVACCVRFLNSVSTNTIKRVDWRRVAPPQDIEPSVDKLKVDGLAHFILPVTDKITTPKDYNNENSFPTLVNFAPKPRTPHVGIIV